MYNILRIGTVCNQNCVFCFNKGYPDYELTLEDIKKSLDSLSHKQKEFVCFSGGEPTLRNDLPKMIKYAKGLGFVSVGIQTNGMKLDDVDILKNLKKEGLTYIYISLHSHNPETLDSLTGVKGSLKRTIKAINNAVNLGLFVELNFVINSKNYKELPDYVKFVESISRNIKIEFSFMLPIKDKTINKKLIPKLSSILPFLTSALDYCCEKKINFRISSCSVPYCVCKNHIDKTVEFEHMVELKRGSKGKPDYDSIKGMTEKARGIELWSSKREKTKKCLDCTLYDYCNGIWNSYLELYGDEEIIPILENRSLQTPVIFLQNKNKTTKIRINNIKKGIDIKNNSKICIDLNEEEYNKNTGKIIINFLTNLKEKEINFTITRPLPKCLFGRDYYDVLNKFNIPKNCEECDELYTLNEDGRIVFCHVTKNTLGPKLKYMKNKKQIHDYFKTFYDEIECLDICKTCNYFLRKQCSVCNKK